MIDKKSWDEFRDSGLLLIINQTLHIFGWAIVVELGDDKKVSTCYPARVKFRGFSEKSTTKAYKNISAYMVDNAEDLYNETLD